MHHPQHSPHHSFDEAAVEGFLDHLARLLARDHLRRSVADAGGGAHRQHPVPRHDKTHEDQRG